MALLCGAYSVFLRKFSCRVSHVRNLRIYGKIMSRMSVLPCLTVRRITVPSSRSSQFLCICQMLSSHLGRYIVPISARKSLPVFVRLWVYVAETFTRCVRKSGCLEQRIFVLVSHKIGWFMTRIHGQYRLVWMERLDASDFICESVLQNSYFIVTKMVLKL